MAACSRTAAVAHTAVTADPLTTGTCTWCTGDRISAVAGTSAGCGGGRGGSLRAARGPTVALSGLGRFVGDWGGWIAHRRGRGGGGGSRSRLSLHRGCRGTWRRMLLVQGIL